MGNKRNKNKKTSKSKAHKKMLQNHAVDMRRIKKELYLAKNHAAGPSGLHSHNSTEQEESQLLTLDSIKSEMDGDEYIMSREHTEKHSESMEEEKETNTYQSVVVELLT